MTTAVGVSNCQDGAWTVPSLRCYKTCEPFEDLGDRQYNVETIQGVPISQRVGAQRKITCAPGFSSTTGVSEQIARCEMTGQWSPLLLDCQINCKAPTAPLTPYRTMVTSLGDASSLPKLAKAGDWYEIQCAGGYTPTTTNLQSEKIYCLGGVWSAVTMGCSQVCPAEAEFVSSKKLNSAAYKVEFGGRNHGDVTKVSCASGYSAAPSSVVADAKTGQVNSQKVSSVQVMCLNGEYETPKLECFQSCPTYSPPMKFYEVAGGAETGLEHGASRTLQCKAGYALGGKNAASVVKTDEVYCADGQWTPTTLVCAPGCSTITLASFFCDLDFSRTQCMSRFDLGWRGLTSSQTDLTKGWPESVPAGTEFYMRCQSNSTFAQTVEDGGRNVWKTIKCLGSEAPALEVQWSIVSFNCGARCSLGYVDYGSAYNYEMRLPGALDADTYAKGGFDQFQNINKTIERVFRFDSEDLDHQKTVLLETEQAFLEHSSSLSSIAAASAFADSTHVSLIQLAATSKSGAWLHRAVARTRADYFSRVNYLINKGLATNAPVDNPLSMARQFHKIPSLVEHSTRAEDFKFPPTKGMNSVAQFHKKRIIAMEAAGMAVPEHLKAMTDDRKVSNTGLVKFNANSYTGKYNDNRIEDETVLAWPRMVFTTPDVRKDINTPKQAVRHSSGSVSFIQLGRASNSTNTNSTEVSAAESCEDANDLFAQLLEKKSYTRCIDAITENKEICDMTAKQMMKSISSNIPPSFTLDADTDMGLLCAKSCKLCAGRDAYAAAGFEKDFSSVLGADGECKNRDATVQGITPGWDCATIIALKGITQCKQTISEGFASSGVDVSKSGLTTETANQEFSMLCPVSCGVCPKIAQLREEAKTEMTKNDYENLNKESQELAKKALVDSRLRAFYASEWRNLNVPHATEVRITCADGYTDASLFSRSATDKKAEDAQLAAEGDGVAAPSGSSSSSLAESTGEVLVCNLGAWSPRTLSCANHCSEFSLPPTMADLYTVSGTGTHHSSSRTISCANGSHGTQGFNSQEVFCLDGKWTARTLTCRRGCSSTDLPFVAPGVVSSLEKEGIDTSSEESTRYSHGAQWKYECTPTAAEREKSLSSGKTLDISSTYNAVEVAGSALTVKNNSQSIQCLNGQWNQLVLMCKRDCGSAPLPDTERYRYSAHKRALDEWAFLYDLEKKKRAAIVEPVNANATSASNATALIQTAASERIVFNPDISQISTRHGDYLNVTCAAGYSAVAGPEDGQDILKCLDGQWQQQTLVCKKDCPEWSPATEELMSNRYIVISPDNTPDYPAVTEPIHHGVQRVLKCNSEEHNESITAATEARISCLDGKWSTPVLLCRKTCPALNPAPFAAGFLFSHFPPWGYCVWDNVLQKCIDVNPDWRPTHDTKVYLNCAPGFSPVSGVTPTQVSCNDGIYSTIWLTCAPDCDASKLQVPVGMKIIKSIVGQVNVTDSDFLVSKYPDVQAPAHRLPNPDQEARYIGDKSAYQYPEVPYYNNTFNAQRLNQQEITALIQLGYKRVGDEFHASSSDEVRASRFSSGPYHHKGSRIRVVDGRFSSADLSDTSIVKINGMDNFDDSFDSAYSGNDTSVYSASILQAMAARGEIQLAKVDLSQVPVTPNSVVYFGCEDWAAPAPGTEIGNSASCFWGSWTLRTLQCRGKCSGDAPRQMLSQYEKSNAYELQSTPESFLPGGKITIRCKDNVADPWPRRYGGGREESATCMDGQFSALSMSCMKRCDPHPLQNSERYTVDAETTYGSEGVYQHGSVMRIGCQEGYSSSLSRNNETSTCIDGTWSTIAMQCYKNCPVLPNPGHQYWVGPMTDRLRLGWGGDNSQFYKHGENLWVRCAAGHTPGLGQTASNVTVTCNDGVFSNIDIVCYESCPPPSTLFFDNYKYKFAIKSEMLQNNVTVHNSQVEISCDTQKQYYHTGKTLNFKESLICKDGSWGDPTIKCRKKCPVFGTSAGSAGISAVNGYTIKAIRPSPQWTPGRVEKQYDPSSVSTDQVFHLHGSFRILKCNTATHSVSRRNNEGTVMPWEGDLLPSFKTGTMSVTVHSNEYTQTGGLGESVVSTANVATTEGSTTAAGTEVVLRDGEDVMVCDDGEWRGRNLVCVRKCPEYVHPLNTNSAAAKRYKVYKLVEEQYAGFNDDVEAEMSLDLTEIPQISATASLFVKQGSRRIVTCAPGFLPQSYRNVHYRENGVPAVVTECKDGMWTQTALTCMRQCTEPFQNVLYRMCKDYHLNNPASVCATNNWQGYFKSKDECVVAVCSVPYEGNSATAVGGSVGDAAGGNTVAAEGEMSASSLLQLAADSYHKRRLIDVPSVEDITETAVQGDVNTDGALGKDPGTGNTLKHNLSPYKIFKSIVTPDPYHFPDTAAGTDIKDSIKMAMLTVKPGDTHIVMCNAQAGFGPVFKSTTTVMNGGGHELNSVAVVSCIDGVWSDMPFRCDRGCIGAYDIHQSWERWLPVFTNDEAYAECRDEKLYWVQDYDKFNETDYNAGLKGIDLSLSEPQGPLMKNKVFGDYVNTHDLVGRAEGMRCKSLLDTEKGRIPKSITVRTISPDNPSVVKTSQVAGDVPYKWPMGLHWAIWGPGCCDPTNCWAGSNGTCKKKIYGRGTWVAYEMLNPIKKGLREANRGVFYARCAAGVPMKNPTVSFFADVESNRLKNLTPQIMWKPSNENSPSRMFSWQAPELPLTYGVSKPLIMYPAGVRKTITQPVGKVATLDCSVNPGYVVYIESVTYKSTTKSNVDGSANAFDAVKDYCNNSVLCKIRVINSVLNAATGFGDCPVSWAASEEDRKKVLQVESNPVVKSGPAIVFAELSKEVQRTGRSADVASELFSDPGIHSTSSIFSNPARLARLQKNEAHVKALLKANGGDGKGILYKDAPYVPSLGPDSVSTTTTESDAHEFEHEEPLDDYTFGSLDGPAEERQRRREESITAFIQRSASRQATAAPTNDATNNTSAPLSPTCASLKLTVVFSCMQPNAFPESMNVLSEIEEQVKEVEMSVIHTYSQAYRASAGVGKPTAGQGAEVEKSTESLDGEDVINAQDVANETASLAPPIAPEIRTTTTTK
eukprot:GDKJ01041082.1.p1 GENE.GDKJ01041082.1~~GDKJ01041082.1.p1  ORF type:complete len:3117 (+),score=784.93 GDKJ01041082.1:135-9353(+)